MGTTTPIRGFFKPSVGETGWAALINAIFDAIDGDIDVNGQIQVWPSGGISITAGVHSDPGAGIIKLDHDLETDNDATFNSGIEVSGLADLLGDLDVAGLATFAGELYIPRFVDNVSNPPTSGELDTAFGGTPNDGFLAIVDDAGLGTDVYLILVSSGTYFILDYSALGGGGVFGDEFSYAESEGNSTSTSSTYAQKVRLTTASLPSGDYLLQWSAEFNIDGGGDTQVRIEQNDTTTLGENTIDSSQDANYQTFAGIKRLSSISGVHTFDIDFRRSSGAGTTNIRRSRVSLHRVA